MPWYCGTYSAGGSDCPFANSAAAINPHNLIAVDDDTGGDGGGGVEDKGSAVNDFDLLVPGVHQSISNDVFEFFNESLLFFTSSSGTDSFQNDAEGDLTALLAPSYNRTTIHPSQQVKDLVIFRIVIIFERDDNVHVIYLLTVSVIKNNIYVMFLHTSIIRIMVVTFHCDFFTKS